MKYQVQISQDRYDTLMGRYAQFLENLKDANKPPVKVFDPLSKKCRDELELIREVSRTLQQKKEEDLKKAAQAAEAVPKATESTETKTTETTEIKATETTGTEEKKE